MVYLKKKEKKKEIPENILTEVLPLGELKYMQHKHHSYKYVLYVGVSCASSRWNWPNRNVVQHQAGFKIFVGLVIKSLSLK